MTALFGIVLASALTLPPAEAAPGLPTVLYVLQETIEGKPGFYGQLPLSEFISATTTAPIGEFDVG
jgi:hypothetical protein